MIFNIKSTNLTLYLCDKQIKRRLKLCKQRLFCLCSKLFIAESKVVWQLASTPAVGGDTQQMFTREGSAPRSNPLPFYIPFFTKKYLFLKPSIDKWYPFHILCLNLCIPFNCCKCPVLLTRDQSQKLNVFSFL